MVLDGQAAMGQRIDWSDKKRRTLMKGILLRWLARYDAWCQEWGLTPENRRCCVPVRREGEEPRDAATAEASSSLTESCESRRR